MKICNKCGAQNTDEAQFCVGCGAALDAPAAPGGANQPSKPPKKKMKAWQIVLIVVAVIVVLCIGVSIFGGGDDEKKETESQSQSETLTVREDESQNENQGNLGDYDVQIKDSRYVNDYEGKKSILVTYTFTNYTEEASNFTTSVSATAYQDGVELGTAYLYDVDGYDAESLLKNVQTGKSVDVQQAYVLDDETTEVEIIVEDLFDITDQNKQTFTINLSDVQ